MSETRTNVKRKRLIVVVASAVAIEHKQMLGELKIRGKLSSTIIRTYSYKNKKTLANDSAESTKY